MTDQRIADFAAWATDIEDAVADLGVRMTAVEGLVSGLQAGKADASALSALSDVVAGLASTKADLADVQGLLSRIAALEQFPPTATAALMGLRADIDTTTQKLGALATTIADMETKLSAYVIGVYPQANVPTPPSPPPGNSLPGPFAGPPAKPSNKIKIHWDTVATGKNPYVAPATIADIVSEMVNCWKVENVSGLAAFDGKSYSTLDALYSAIAPTAKGLGGCEAQLDEVYVALGQGGISMDVGSCDWWWTSAGDWTSRYPFTGGTHLRSIIGHSTPIFSLADGDFAATLGFENLFLGPFPCEYRYAGAGVVAAAAGNVITVASIDHPPDTSTSYTEKLASSGQFAYSVVFDGNVTAALKDATYTVTANTTGPNFTITLSGTPNPAPAAGDTFYLRSGVQAGSDLFSVWGAGRIVRNHVATTRVYGNGVAVHETFGNGLRTHTKFFDYDCMTYGCGSTPSEHNHYLHYINYYAERCYSHSACGDAWKIECNTAVLNACTAAGHMHARTPIEGNVGWGNNNQLMDMTQNDRTWFMSHTAIPTNFTSASGKRQWCKVQNRFGDMSQQFSELPRATHPGPDGVGNLANDTYYRFGSPNAAQSLCGTVAVAAAAGAGSVQISNLCSPLIQSTQPKGAALTMAGADGYDIQLHYTDNTVYTGKLTVTSIGSTNAGTISPALSKATAVGKLAIVKLAPNNWDYPLLDSTVEPFYNSQHAQYVWGAGTTHGIRDSSGKLDLTKQKQGKNGAAWGYPAQYVDGVSVRPTAVTTGVWLWGVIKECYGAYLTAAYLGHICYPPQKSNAASPAWSDPPNAGSWTGQLTGAGLSPPLGSHGSGGTGVRGSDFVRPNFSALRHQHYWNKGMGAINQFDTSLQPAAGDPIAEADIPVRCMVLTNAGVIDVADNAKSKPYADPVMFQATANCNAGGNAVVVDSIAGLSNGMHMAIETENQWGLGLGTHFCTIASINGSTLTFSPALPTGARAFMNIKSGAKISAMPAAIAWPAWALDPTTDFFS